MISSFYFLFFVLSFLFPLLVIVIAGFAIKNGFRTKKEHQSVEHKNEMIRLVNEHHFAFASGAIDFKTNSSLPHGTKYDLMSGSLEDSKNNFWQYIEDHRMQQGVERRTVTLISCPDIMSHINIISKIHADNINAQQLNIFHDSQKITLEGDFSKFFDVYAPKTDETGLLVLLTPNVMEFFIQKMTNFDIEIIGPYLYIHHYGLLTPQERFSALNLYDNLVKIMSLTKNDVRQTEGLDSVSRIALDNTKVLNLKKDPKKLIIKGGFLGSIAMLVTYMATIASNQVRFMQVFALTFLLVSIFTLYRIFKSQFLRAKLAKRRHG